MENKALTPEQALANLDLAAANTNANRKTHLALIDSVNIMSEILKQHRESEMDKKEGTVIK